MTAYSSVRSRVKPGQDERFEQLFRSAPRNFEGLRRMAPNRSPNGTNAGNDVLIGDAPSFACPRALGLDATRSPPRNHRPWRSQLLFPLLLYCPTAPFPHCLPS